MKHFDRFLAKELKKPYLRMVANEIPPEWDAHSTQVGLHSHIGGTAVPLGWDNIRRRKITQLEPVIETNKNHIMSDIKFDIYESPGDGEKKKFHVRTTNRQTISSKDIIHEATRYSTVSRADWMAVVEGLIECMSEQLSSGKRIHINGLGYFSVNIGSSESENPKAMTRRTVRVTGVNFLPEKSFMKSIRSQTGFTRERYKFHTADLSPIEADDLLTKYFKDHRSITCAQFQQTCGMTRTTAYRRLAALVQGDHPSLLREGYKNSTVYIPSKGHYGRSYEDERW